jgi:hypothetical protein
MAENNRAITLYAYEIENEEIGAAYSDLMEKLAAKLLIQKETAGDRRLNLNKESKEEDLLSDYSANDKYVFGVMWRIAPAIGSPSIPDGLFDHEKIQMSEIQNSGDESPLICKDHSYFSVNKHFLVTNIPKSRIKSLQTYLNWLLEATRGDKIYTFTPKIEAPHGILLSDIKNIVVKDPTFKNKKKKTEKKEEQSHKVFKFASDQLLSLLKEVPDLQQMIEKKILSAQLLVKFTKPSKMEDEDYKKLLGAYMKPICDTDGVTFTTKNGKKIKGTEILLTKLVEVEILANKGISEPALILEMECFLRELNKNK